MQSDIPLISFVVPCYNYGRFLPECLNSIFRQDANYPYEVIIIDDASTDNTAEVLASIRSPTVRIIQHTENKGHLDTITEGLQLARGQFVARIDPDDRYRSCFLSTLIPLLQENPEVGFAYGDVACMDAAGKITIDRADRVHGGRDFKGNEFIALLYENFISAPAVIARREAWLEALPLPPNLAFNDWYFNLMIARRHDFYYVHRVVADYRVHASNWHRRIVLDRTEEPSIMRLLDLIYRAAEKDAVLERAKQHARRRVYACQYVTLADKYFGLMMNSDARRCYVRAVKNQPSLLVDPGVMRRLMATVVGRSLYENSKRLVKTTKLRRGDQVAER